MKFEANKMDTWSCDSQGKLGTLGHHLAIRSSYSFYDMLLYFNTAQFSQRCILYVEEALEVHIQNKYVNIKLTVPGCPNQVKSRKG